MSALFYGSIASHGKIEGPVLPISDDRQIRDKKIKDSIVLIKEISLDLIMYLISYPPKGLIVEKKLGNTYLQKCFKKAPMPSIGGLRNITGYFKSGDIVIIDCKNTVVIGKMSKPKFFW